MRLLRIEKAAGELSLQFEEFMGGDIPPYAILSHTWEEEEVSYDDFVAGRGPLMMGYAKIKGCAKKARKHGLEYIWVDTCCIDKRSSAELTEAINSMYKWYENSTECYAYLVDVPSKRWEQSRWFTRGWTLQELLAPDNVTFYDADWRRLFARDEETESLSTITGIDDGALGQVSVHYFTVATRMSWASKRTTTRVEDTAYCLMGIFGVNMPLLYGEGQSAFIRLQEHIARATTDQSLLAWRSNDPGLYASPLASSPSYFARVEDAFPAPVDLDFSSMGCALSAYLLPVDTKRGLFKAVLRCGTTNNFLAIHLSELFQYKGDSFSPRRFFRTRASILEESSNKGNIIQFDIDTATEIIPLVLLNTGFVSYLRKLPHHTLMLDIPKRFLVEVFDSQYDNSNILSGADTGDNWFGLFELRAGKLAGFHFKNSDTEGVLVVGLSDSGNSWCKFLPTSDPKAAYRSYKPQGLCDLERLDRTRYLTAVVWLTHAKNELRLRVQLSW